MPHIARIVIPNYLLHVTQPGNRRQRVVFNDDDYIFYKNLRKREPGSKRENVVKVTVPLISFFFEF